MPIRRLSLTVYLMSRAIAFIRLIRLPNAVALALLFVVAQIHFGSEQLSLNTFIAACVWLTIAAFSYAINDYFDIAIDAINNPTRPLPSGQIKLSEARASIVVMAALAVLLSILMRPIPAWPFFLILIALAYSAVLRPFSALASNVAAAVMVAAVPWSAFDLPLSLDTVSFLVGIALLIFARETQKDILDHRGDSGHRPAALFEGALRNVMRVCYPVIVLSSYGLILLAFSTSSGFKVAVAVLTPLYILMLVVGRNAKLQVRLAKSACYLMIPILLA